MLYDSLGKLLEDTVHISALSRPQTLQEANMAAMTGDEKGQVRIPLHSLHWNGWGGGKEKIKKVKTFSFNPYPL